MKRIAVAGFQHETNTFADHKADFQSFSMTKDWPPLCSGPDMLDTVAGFHLPVVGALSRLSQEPDAEIVPLTWAFAVPCGHVTRDAFERIAGMITDQLAAAGTLDGVYLDLHGAMVSEHYEDAEGELLRRIAMLAGSGVPVAASLDYHANITEKMLEYADYLDVYREYPHTDMAETGYRTAHILLDMIDRDIRYHKALRKPDYLIPLNLGCTTIEPCRTLMANLNTLRGNLPDLTHMSFAAGFALSDIHEAGPAILVHAQDKQTADNTADHVLELLKTTEQAFEPVGLPAPAAVEEAMGQARHAALPIIIADTQDNPGAGGSGDTTGVLRALLAAGAEDALCGFIADGETALQAHVAGEGAEIKARLGGKLFKGDRPVQGTFRVLALGDGEFTGTGPMWKGARMQLGLCALLERGGVQIAVSSKTIQTGDQSMFRHLGVDPTGKKIIALKSSVHFRADFEPIAHSVLVALAPGPVLLDPGQIPYRNIRPDVRLSPNGQTLQQRSSA
ncbi:M81 family metallopeptidase [Sneathiella chinensis]|uniref:Microcystinase C n=1 Tax=Sneathiella chinensis TaxID=349750 RepID=A0ABQ5U6R4_9PROT|nr:M81 family metallopeptidase [Sneathiella chinensis]GLQ07378.1 microcystinase C [Sneathiella chinensis]